MAAIHCIELPIEQIRAAITYEASTGIMTWKQSGRRRRVGEVVSRSTDRDGYLLLWFAGKELRAHRVAWVCATGAWPAGQIDHINGNKIDNRLVNLRDVTTVVNQQNQRGPHRGNKLGFMGVSLTPPGNGFVNKLYRVDIRFGGKQHFLGRFETAEEAHQVYLEAKRKHHPGNTL